MLLLKNNAVVFQDCIDICIKCAQACNKCFKACLEKDHINEMKEVLALLVDCAEICYVTAAYLSSNHLFAAEITQSCAELCSRCAAICETYEDMECKASVELCRQCADMCHRVHE